MTHSQGAWDDLDFCALDYVSLGSHTKLANISLFVLSRDGALKAIPWALSRSVTVGLFGGRGST